MAFKYDTKVQIIGKLTLMNFSSKLYNFCVEIGYGEGYDETLQFGSVESLVFCVVYRRKERLTGVCCIGCDNLHSELALVFENNMEWIGEVPPAITQRFPQPPLKTQAQ